MVVAYSSVRAAPIKASLVRCQNLSDNSQYSRQRPTVTGVVCEGPIMGGNMIISCWNYPSGPLHFAFRRPKGSRAAAGENANSTIETPGGKQWRFPLKAAMTAGSLALVGDTVAQLRGRWDHINSTPDKKNSNIENKDFMVTKLLNHDWLRALRMTTYGFLLYGPGSEAWYELLDRTFQEQSLKNISVKVILNQIVLGPCVIAAVFAWNSLWQGKLKELPDKYRKDAMPSLIYGWKFWVPASLLNFWAVPLQARVAFMSCCAIFWNYYLSTTMVKS